MSEYLSEEEQLEKLRSWWKQYGTWLLLGLLVVGAGYGGWQWYQRYTAEQAGKAEALYQAWLDAGEDSAKQEVVFTELESLAKGDAYHSFLLLRQAARFVKAGELEKAEPLLQKVVDGSGDALLRNLAMLRLAAVLQGLDRSDDALKLLDRVSGEGYKGLALELKGDIHSARGEQEVAHKAYVAAFATLEQDQKDSLLEAKVNNSSSPPESVVSDKPSDTDVEAAAGQDASDGTSPETTGTASEEAAEPVSEDSPTEEQTDGTGTKAAESGDV